MYGMLTALHLVVCFALVVSVLLQSGKGGGLAGAFGGGGGAAGQTIFGGRGAATFLSKATTVLGALFLLTALLLAMVPRGGQMPARSLIQEQAQEAQPTQPVDAAAPPGAFQDLPGGEGALPAGETPPPAEGTPAQGEGATDEAQPTPPGSPTEEDQEDSGGGQ